MVGLKRKAATTPGKHRMELEIRERKALRGKVRPVASATTIGGFISRAERRSRFRRAAHSAQIRTLASPQKRRGTFWLDFGLRMLERAPSLIHDGRVEWVAKALSEPLHRRGDGDQTQRQSTTVNSQTEHPDSNARARRPKEYIFDGRR